MDGIGTRHVIDIAILGASLLLAVAGFWRGVAKEVFISAGVLLGYLLAIEWSARWGEWLGDGTRLTTREGTFTASAAVLVLGSVIVGYVGCATAGLPPADVPGRLGGFVLGATNAVFATSVVLGWARNLVLNSDRLATLDTTQVGRRLSGSTDWVLIGAAAVALILVAASWQIRKRQRPIVSITGAPRQGESGFRLRRESPLAPEPEKIERVGQGATSSSWTVPDVYAETAPLNWVPDPSGRTDRPARGGGQIDSSPAPWRTDSTVRCISCGVRIGDDDRFCPRCGRQLT